MALFYIYLFSGLSRTYRLSRGEVKVELCVISHPPPEPPPALLLPSSAGSLVKFKCEHMLPLFYLHS